MQAFSYVVFRLFFINGSSFCLQRVGLLKTFNLFTIFCFRRLWYYLLFNHSTSDIAFALQILDIAPLRPHTRSWIFINIFKIVGLFVKVSLHIFFYRCLRIDIIFIFEIKVALILRWIFKLFVWLVFSLLQSLCWPGGEVGLTILFLDRSTTTSHVIQLVPENILNIIVFLFHKCLQLPPQPAVFFHEHFHLGIMRIHSLDCLVGGGN